MALPAGGRTVLAACAGNTCAIIPVLSASLSDESVSRGRPPCSSRVKAMHRRALTVVSAVRLTVHGGDGPVRGEPEPPCAGVAQAQRATASPTEKNQQKLSEAGSGAAAAAADAARDAAEAEWSTGRCPPRERPYILSSLRAERDGRPCTRQEARRCACSVERSNASQRDWPRSNPLPLPCNHVASRRKMAPQTLRIVREFVSGGMAMSSGNRSSIDIHVRWRLVRERRALPHIDAHTPIRTNVTAAEDSRASFATLRSEQRSRRRDSCNEAVFAPSHAQRGARRFKCDF